MWQASQEEVTDVLYLMFVQICPNTKNMEVFENLGVKIPDAVLVTGMTETEKDDEVLDFLKQCCSINRTGVVNEPRSEFHQNLIVECSSGTALAALEPLLPYIYITEDEDNKYRLRYLASIYTENVGNRKTQLYLADLKL